MRTPKIQNESDGVNAQRWRDTCIHGTWLCALRKLKRTTDYLSNYSGAWAWERL